MVLPAQPDTVPLVIVEGFCCSAGAIIWGNFHEHSNQAHRAGGTEDRRVIFAQVGPASSLHDRACELFYSLVGGTVDYGEEHARIHGHKRFGRTHTSGLYPAWFAQNPLHFLGHSLGGPTILKLQWLLTTGFFGAGYHPDMILSVNAVSAPFRGTQLVYLLGEDAQDAPAVRRPSVGHMLAGAAHILAYLAPLLPAGLDMHAEARSLAVGEASVRATLRQLWRSDWAETEDAAPFDVTFQAVRRREACLEGAVSPGTYYRSYVACMTEDRAEGSPGVSWRHWLTMPLLCLSSRAMAQCDLPSLVAKQDTMNTAEKGLAQEGCGEDAFSANDGVVPVFSQAHPLDCSETKCRHSTYSLDDSRGNGADMPRGPGEPTTRHEEPEGGIWHVHHIDGAHHVSIVPFWMGTARQKAFWRDLGSWLHAIDAKRCGTINVT